MLRTPDFPAFFFHAETSSFLQDIPVGVLNDVSMLADFSKNASLMRQLFYRRLRSWLYFECESSVNSCSDALLNTEKV